MALLNTPLAASQPTAQLDVAVKPMPLWGSAVAFGVPTLLILVPAEVIQELPWLDVTRMRKVKEALP